MGHANEFPLGYWLTNNNSVKESFYGKRKKNN